jgi:hypothetical protein
LVAAKRELACAAWYDFTVVNDRLVQAVKKVEAIMIGRTSFSAHQHARGLPGDAWALGAEGTPQRRRTDRTPSIRSTAHRATRTTKGADD